jgi:hypothetical protein
MRIGRESTVMKSYSGKKISPVAEYWRATRPLPWRLRSLINQRRRSGKR